MNVYALYQPKSEFARSVEEYAKNYKRADSTRKISLIDVDSKEGSNMAALYGVLQYPAILVTTTDGQMLALWQGPNLPLMNEVAAYERS